MFYVFYYHKDTIIISVEVMTTITVTEIYDHNKTNTTMEMSAATRNDAVHLSELVGVIWIVVGSNDVMFFS